MSRLQQLGVIALVATLLACDSDDDGNGGAAGTMATAPTWTEVYTNVIAGTGCNGGALCHAGNAGGALIMNDAASAYTALVGVAAMGVNLIENGTPDCATTGLVRVVAGDPDQSLLIQKLEGTQTCGTEMPQGNLLAPAIVADVRAWIAAGAPNN